MKAADANCCCDGGGVASLSKRANRPIFLELAPLEAIELEILINV